MRRLLTECRQKSSIPHMLLALITCKIYAEGLHNQDGMIKHFI